MLRKSTFKVIHQVRFSDPLITRAKALRSLGLAWDPRPGRFVWDEESLIEKLSPFQKGVYFILDLKHFLRRAGTLEALKEAFVWLPTWHDAREILANLAVTDATVASRLASQQAIESQNELMVLYELIAERLGECGD